MPEYCLVPMPYPKKLLNDYETLALDLHPHWWFFAESVFTLIVTIALGVVAVVADAPGWMKWAVLVLIVAAALWVLVTYLKWVTTNFVITSDRVIFRHGVFAKSGIEIPLERVNSVHFNQGVWERIVGAGDLLIESGAKEGQQRFTDVRNPDRVQNLIHSQMEANEQKTFGTIRQANRTAGGSPMPPPPPSTGGTSPDVISQLEKLEALRDRGSLSPQEFETQKRRLLDG
ncbi:MAG: PH domain-containing protein [Ilumatobacteraceae bacterium]